MTDGRHAETVVVSHASLAQWGKSFQEKVLQGMLSDRQWAEQLMEVFKVEYFDLNYLRFLADRYFAHAKRYKVFPTLQLLVTIIRDELKNGTDIVLRDQIIDYMQRMRSNPDPGDLHFVKEKTLEFMRKQALKQALEDAVDQMAANKYEQIVDGIKRAVCVGTTPQLGHDFFQDYESRFTLLQRNCVPTGIKELDAKDILNGGLGAGELGCVVGGTGTGKCVGRETDVVVRYVVYDIGGKRYKPWDVVKTKRGDVFARDVSETDELT